MNAAAGNGKRLSLEIAIGEDGYPARVGELAGPMGARMAFEEIDVGWESGRHFRQVRRYLTGPLARSRYEVVLERDGDGVVPSLTLELEPRSGWLSPVLGLRLGAIRRAWQRVLDSLPAPGGPPPARRRLSSDTESALDRWRVQLGESELPERLMQHLQSAPRTQLQQLRPFALADAWGTGREATLVSMIQGVDTGLFEVIWALTCPRCTGQALATRDLSSLHADGECASCQLSFTADLADNVEVVFALHPGLGFGTETHYCTIYPAASPEIPALFYVPPKTSLERAVDLPPGRWVLRTNTAAGDLPLQVAEGAPAQPIVFEADATTALDSVAPGEVALQIDNPRARPARVFVTASEPPPTRVPASLLTTHPLFKRSLGQQVLSPDVQVTVRSVALLFTDLSGSTELYEAMGDASAFAFVRDHFALMREIIDKRGGVLVKTIGDAVMAAFHRPESALRAGLELLESYDTWLHSQALPLRPGLKVGVHRGSALVVHGVEAGVDYFGATVNVAARAQGQAAAGQLVWTEAVAESVDVPALLAERGLVAEPFEARLKGVQGAHRLYRAAFGSDR